MAEDYARFSRLLIDRPHPGVLRVVMNRPDKLNATDGRMHSELTEIWRDVAVRLAEGAPNAIRWTKYALNNWLRAARPIFDASLGMEFLGFSGHEALEGAAALRGKRPPRFSPDAV
jgi:enoyl-CoA hydratase/carnithine racemase